MPSLETESLTRIEAKLDRLVESTSLVRERVSRAEEWRSAHENDHRMEGVRERWIIGLILGTLATSLSTAAIVLLH